MQLLPQGIGPHKWFLVLDASFRATSGAASRRHEGEGRPVVGVVDCRLRVAGRCVTAMGLCGDLRKGRTLACPSWTAGDGWRRPRRAARTAKGALVEALRPLPREAGVSAMAVNSSACMVVALGGVLHKPRPSWREAPGAEARAACNPLLRRARTPKPEGGQH